MSQSKSSPAVTVQENTDYTRLSYIPPHLIEAEYLGRLSDPDSFRSFRGTLLMADLAGSTHLTERLQERGREGAEEVTALVNAALGPMVDCVDGRRGSILQFGGDAIFALFDGRYHQVRALSAAAALMALLRKLGPLPSTIGSVRLEMKVVLAAGRMTEYHLDAHEQTIYLLGGETPERLDRLLKSVASGEILVDKGLARQFQEHMLADPRGGLLQSAPLTVPSRPWHRTTSAPPRLLRYLPGELLRRLASQQLEEEYRAVPVCFIRFELEEPGLPSAEAAEILSRFMTELVKVLSAHNGVILKHALSPRCETVLAVFGLWSPHEDDSIRATMAALALKDRIAFARLPVRLAVSVHFGVVVATNVGSIERRVFDVMGDAVNLAARLTEATPWGQVRISGPVARMCKGRIQLESLGPVRFRGKEVPVAVHRVLGLQHAQIPARVRSLPPLVGRETQLATLEHSVEQLKQGRGGVVAICADTGMGKSRFWLEVRFRLRRQGIPSFHGVCPSFGGTSGFAVFADLLRRTLGMGPSVQDLDEDGLRVNLATLGMEPDDLPHLTAILGLTGKHSALRGAELKAGNFAFMRRLVTRWMAQGPVVIMLEDVDWAAPTSLELIEQLAREVSEGPLLLCISHRSEFSRRWRALSWLRSWSRFQEVPLGPLREADSQKMLAGMLEGGVLPSQLERRLVEHSGGVPFFLEELVRAMKELGWLVPGPRGLALVDGAQAADLPLPDTIDALLSARLHRLPIEVKRTIQRAAVIGRQFSRRVLASVGEQGLEDALRSLQEREILFELPSEGDGDCQLIFKHALTREVAYRSLLERKRQVLHGRVARGLMRLHADALEDQAACLAWHLSASDSPQDAVPHFVIAVRHALSQGRFAEARKDAERALEIMQDGEVGSSGHRFSLLLARGDAVAWAGDYALVLAIYREAEPFAPGDEALAELHGRMAFVQIIQGELEAAVHTARRGLDLARAVGGQQAESRCLRELGLALRKKGELEQSLRVYREAGNLVVDSRAPIRSLVLRGLGASLVEAAQWEAGAEVLGQALALLQGEQDRRGAIDGLLWLARCALGRGRLDLAVRQVEEAHALARGLEEPAWLLEVALVRVDVELAVDHVDDAKNTLVDATQLSVDLRGRGRPGALALRSARLATRGGQWRVAAEHAEAAYNFFVEGNGLSGGAQALSTLVSLALIVDDVVGARRWMEQPHVAEETQEMPPLCETWRVLEGIARLMEGRSDWLPPLQSCLSTAQRLPLPSLVACLAPLMARPSEPCDSAQQSGVPSSAQREALLSALVVRAFSSLG